MQRTEIALHYDFGDDWMFTITVSKISEVQEILSLVSLKQKEAFNSIQTGKKMSLAKNNVLFVPDES